MVINLATICGAIVCVFIWGQLCYVLWYVRFLRSSRSARYQLSKSNANQTNYSTATHGGEYPKVAVILCLRGNDPSLQACLNSLMDQRYPNWSLHLIFDSPNDPALDIVHQTFAGRELPNLHFIQPISDNASLKCQAICQAIRTLPQEFEYLAFVDADTLVDPNWLSDLLTPMFPSDEGPTCMATTGNRWFIPAEPSSANYLRQIWNGAAVVQMALYDIAWGGSFAIKRQAIEETGLVHRWERAFCEDTMLSQVLADHQMKLQRVPDLIMANCELTDMPGVYRWITRQLITVRLYHRNWGLVQLHALAVFFCGWIVPLIAVGLLFGGDFFGGGAILFFWLAYQIANYSLVAEVESENVAILKLRSADVAVGINHPIENTRAAESETYFRKNLTNLINQAAGRRHSATYLGALILTQIFHPLACLQATFTNKVVWRGIEYRILPDKSLALMEYKPSRNSQQEMADKNSI